MPYCKAAKFHSDSLIAVIRIHLGMLTVSDIVQMCCHANKDLALAICSLEEESKYLGDIEIVSRRIRYARTFYPELTGDNAVVHLLQIDENADVSIFSSYVPSSFNVDQEPHELFLAGASSYDIQVATRRIPKPHNL